MFVLLSQITESETFFFFEDQILAEQKNSQEYLNLNSDSVTMLILLECLQICIWQIEMFPPEHISQQLHSRLLQ